MTEKKEKIYTKGFMFFKPSEKAPDWVKASVVCTKDEFDEFFEKVKEFHSEYKGKKQLRMQLLQNDKGYYFVVDTFKPQQKQTEGTEETKDDNELPF